MLWPHITAGYLAVLALTYTALAINVMRLRNINRAARLAHPAGMYARPMSVPFRIFRIGAMWLTMIVLVAGAAMILLRLWHGA